MSARRLIATAAVVSSAAFAGACGTGGSSGEDGGSADEIQFGYTATLSGEFASYGEEMRNGVELAVDEINADGGIDGAEISLNVEDDQGKPGNGPVVAQTLCDEEENAAVFGYSFSSVALAAIPIYDRCGLPVVASAVTSPELSGASSVFFRDVLSDDSQGRQMGEYAVEELGLESIAVLNQKDDYGIGTADGFIAGVEDAGGEIVSRDEYQIGTRSFDSQLAGIADSDPDAIYIGGFYAEAARIAQQARDQGLDQQILGSDGSLSPDLVELGGDAVEDMYLYGVFSPQSDAPGVSEFVDAYEQEYGEDPTSWAALAYDAVYTTKQAIEDAGGSTRDDVVSGLGGVTYDGVTGEVSFDENGDRQGDVTFLQVQDGEFAIADAQAGGEE